MLEELKEKLTLKRQIIMFGIMIFTLTMKDKVVHNGEDLNMYGIGLIMIMCTLFIVEAIESIKD